MKTTSADREPADIRTHELAVDGRHGPLLEPTTLRARAGQCLLVSGDAGHGHTAFALALAGRLVPTGGRVLLDGGSDAPDLQRSVAVVDTPGVTEPDDVLDLAVVVGEGLATAGRPATRRAVREFLHERGVDHLAGTRLDQLPADVRLSVLLELGAARPGVRVVVLTLPDRHGGPPSTWWRIAEELSNDQQVTVLVTCTPSSAQILGVAHAELGGKQ